MERPPSQAGNTRIRRSPQEALEAKLQRVRSHPSAQVLLVQSPEVGAFFGLLIGLDHVLGVLKRQVPHLISIESFRELLEQVQRLNIRLSMLVEAHGLTPQGVMGARQVHRLEFSELEQEARHPKAQVFIPHHEETLRLSEMVRDISTIVSRARAALSVETQQVSVFQDVYDMLDAYDQQVVKIATVVGYARYTTPKFLDSIRTRAQRMNPDEDGSRQGGTMFVGEGLEKGGTL